MCSFPKQSFTNPNSYMIRKLIPAFIALSTPVLWSAEQPQHTLGETWEPAICFSVYRDGQSPLTQTYPTTEEIAADLQLIGQHFRLLRLYDCSEYAVRLLETIRAEQLPFKVLLGASLDAEFANPKNSWTDWAGVNFEKNRTHNDEETDRLITLANEYSDIITAVAVGNESLVDWTDHPVTPERSLELVLKVKHKVTQPVTVCDNWVPWRDDLGGLAEAVDFISLHTYPQWEGKSVEQALDYSKANYYAVRAAHPGKKVIITEAGWCTTSDHPQMLPGAATEENQTKYIGELLDWAQADQITLFLFEAVDENWKGSESRTEPEKHWGLYRSDRTPKKAVESLRKLTEE